MESFCGMMDMLPPLGSTSYSEYNRRISRVSMEEATKNMLAASEQLHCLHGVEPDELLDCAVTCDGTWSKRGKTATHGV